MNILDQRIEKQKRQNRNKIPRISISSIGEFFRTISMTPYSNPGGKNEFQYPYLISFI